MEGDRGWCRSVTQFWGRFLVHSPSALPVQPSAILQPWAAWRLSLPVPACHRSPHEQAQWGTIPLDPFGLTTKPPQSLQAQRALGRCSRPQFCLCIPKILLSPYAEACSDLITLYQGVKLEVFGCPRTVLAMGLYARPQLQKSLGAKRSPLPSSPRAVPGQTHIHSVLGVLVQLSCAPGPPCPEHAGTFESQLEVNQRRHIIHIWCVKPKQPVHIFFYNEISSFLADFSQAHKLLIPLITYHA